MRNTLRLVGMTALATALPLVAFAEVRTACGLVLVLERILGIFASIVFIIAVIMLLYAGFLFITGGGNEEKIKTARMTLIWALVGIAVAIFAQFGVPFVRDLIGENTILGSCPTNIQR